MGLATAHTRLARRVALTTAVMCATAVFVAPTTRADDLDIRALEISITGGAAIRAALLVDSDGDGWTDWAERLNGTDPKNPASHPQQVTLEIVGTTVYQQPVAFPDKLAIITLALPETTIPGSSLLPTVAGLAGLTPNAKLTSQLSEMLTTMYDGGMLATLLSSLDKGQASLPNFGVHSNGMDISLISAADVLSWEQWKQLQEDAEFVASNDISVGTTTDGEPFIEVRNSEGVQTHIRQDDGAVSSWLINNVPQPDGSTVMFWTHMTNGVTDSYGKKVTKKDGSQEYWEYDANGNETGHGTTPPRSSAGANTQPPPPTGKATDPATGSTQTSDPTSKSTASTSYSNPDADPYQPPTSKEIAARIAFLTGVRVHTMQNPPTITGTLVPKPGVADPADPACDKAGCVVLIEAMSPNLHRVAGGDPVPPDLADRVPPLH